MAFRTPEEALEALRDGRQIYSGGELIDDVTNTLDLQLYVVDPVSSLFNAKLVIADDATSIADAKIIVRGFGKIPPPILADEVEPMGPWRIPEGDGARRSCGGCTSCRPTRVR